MESQVFGGSITKTHFSYNFFKQLKINMQETVVAG